MKVVELRVEGMKCQGCADSVTGALEGVSGVESADVSLDEGHATVRAGDEVTSEALVRAVDAAGYGASPAA